MNTQESPTPTIEQANNTLYVLIRKQKVEADIHDALQKCRSVLHSNAIKAEALQNKVSDLEISLAAYEEEIKLLKNTKEAN